MLGDPFGSDPLVAPVGLEVCLFRSSSGLHLVNKVHIRDYSPLPLVLSTAPGGAKFNATEGLVSRLEQYP